jgi:2'-5' RNA ligase
VLFLTPVEGTEALRNLVAGVDERLDPVLGEGRDHEFKAHLTVGRVRQAGRGFSWRAALDAVQVSPTVTRIADVTLYQSRLSPKGPTYTALSSHG